jgi:hypothetical protein
LVFVIYSNKISQLILLERNYAIDCEYDFYAG